MTEVEKIHREIDTAQDRLLREALLLISMNEVSEEMKLKAERLAKVGFVNNPLTKTVESKTNVLVKETAQADLIKYYRDIYPKYKFLTEEEFDRICDKYKLVYAPVSSYVKDIPESNLWDIEHALPIMSQDVVHNHFKYTNLHKWRDGVSEKAKEWVQNFTSKQHLSEEEVVKLCPFRITNKENFFTKVNWESTEYIKEGLFIAAPKSHFNFADLTQKGKGWFKTKFTVEPKDPIVFRYVKGGLQVITKWGEEANDPNLTIF